MWADVVVLDDADYASWLAGETPEPVALAEANADEQGRLRSRSEPREDENADLDMVVRGRQVAVSHGCLQCHTIDGQPHLGPTWRGLYGAVRVLDDGRVIRADEGYLSRSMMDPDVDRVRDFEPAMPSYHGLLEPAEVAGLVEYIKSLAPREAPAAIDLPAVDVLEDASPEAP
jgi:cytochrome c oxidase subunit 2